MKNPNSFATVIILVGLTVLLATACNKHVAETKPDNVDYYTCTMHPSVRSQDPKGKCPICSMDLVPVMKKGAAGTNATNATAPISVNSDEKPDEFTVPVLRQQQIGVTYATIARQPFSHAIRAGGIVTYDKQRLMGSADLSVVWVWTQFYEGELPMLKKGLPVTITSPSYPGETFAGKISVIDPLMNEAFRAGGARIDVNNSSLKLRPDMYVDAELTVDMGEGIAVPVNAVLPTGTHNIVFVDKGGGRLEPRFIGIGRKYGDFYEVKSGLKEGERIVTSANFLIDAEANVQGALKSW